MFTTQYQSGVLDVAVMPPSELDSPIGDPDREWGERRQSPLSERLSGDALDVAVMPDTELDSHVSDPEPDWERDVLCPTGAELYEEAEVTTQPPPSELESPVSDPGPEWLQRAGQHGSALLSGGVTDFGIPTPSEEMVEEGHPHAAYALAAALNPEGILPDEGGTGDLLGDPIPPASGTSPYYETITGIRR